MGDLVVDTPRQKEGKRRMTMERRKRQTGEHPRVSWGCQRYMMSSDKQPERPVAHGQAPPQPSSAGCSAKQATAGNHQLITKQGAPRNWRQMLVVLETDTSVAVTHLCPQLVPDGLAGLYDAMR